MPVKTSLAAAIICLTLPAAAFAQSSGTTAGNGTPQTGTRFLQQVQKDSNNEIGEALMAEQRATSPAVQAYARLLVVDHTSLQGELKAVEPSSDVADNASSGQSQTSQVDQALSNAQGAQFDRAFINHEITQNKQSLSSWQRAAEQNGPVGTFAKIGLNMQQQHTMLGEAVQAQLQNSSEKASSGG